MTKCCLLILMVGFLACSSEVIPKDILPPEKMTPVIFDLIKADHFVDDYVLRDTLLKNKEQHIKMYEQVFLIHNTNHNEFYKSFKYYQQHPEINKGLFDSILSYSTKQRELLFRSKHEMPVKK